MQRSPRDLIRGFGALVTTLALLVGVPLLLARFGGWPLPHGVPNLPAVLRGLTSELQVAHVMKALLLTCWMAWLALAWSLVSELAALRSGRTPRPRRSLAPFQVVAARLVTGITLLVSLSTVASSAASAAPLLARAPIAPAVQTINSTATFTTLPRVETPGPAAPVAEGSVVVEVRDSLHRLAEVHLGDAMRWREIWDLNRDHTMLDGSTFTRPEVIRPGWVLQLPAAPSQTSAASPTTVIVAPGDDLSGLAASHLGDETKWHDIFAANQGRHFGELVFDQPDLIQPGWELTLPVPLPPAPHDVQPPMPASPAPAPAPTAASPSVAPTAPELPATFDSQAVIVANAVAAAPHSLPTSTFQTTSSLPPTTVPTRVIESAPWTNARKATGLAGATLLTTGISLLLATRRRRRLRSMGTNHRLPVTRSAEMDVTIRQTADSALVHRVDLALRALAASVRASATSASPVVFDSAAEISWRPDLPQPLAVLVRKGGEIDLLLDRPIHALIAPFLVTDDPLILRLHPSVATADLASVGATTPSPCPTLVMIGVAQTNDGDADLYLNLEGLGGLSINGVGAEGVLRAIVATLAVSPFGVSGEVMTHGITLGSFADAANVETYDDLDIGMRSALQHTAGRRKAEPDTAGFVLRATQPEEAWETSVLVVLDATSDALRTVIGSAGVVVVAGRPVEGISASLTKVEHGWRLTPFGMLVTPLMLDDDTLCDIATVLADASASPEVVAPPITVPDLPAFVETDWSFLVRVLGPVDVISRTHNEVEFERSKALELVVWLAQHRHNPTRIAARTALWQVNVQDATFANVVSDARRSMARSLTGTGDHDWIARNLGDRIPLHDSVVTDVSIVEARLAWARQTTGSDAVEVLRHAVALLRDQPYAGADYLWPDDDALPSGLTHLATSTTSELAQRCLEAGDFDGVFAATATGLRILPGHDELVCLRMQAHHRLGNTAGVRSEYAAYERVILSECGGESDPSPRVTRMRAQLLAVAAGVS